MNFEDIDVDDLIYMKYSQQANMQRQKLDWGGEIGRLVDDS